MTSVIEAEEKFKPIDIANVKASDLSLNHTGLDIFSCIPEQDDSVFATIVDEESKLYVIKKVFDGEATFYSLNYIVRTSKLKKSDVKRILLTSNIFTESKMVTLKGDDIFYLNNFMNRLKDVWAGILFINYVKYVPWTP